jgi:hypothetical protein
VAGEEDDFCVEDSCEYVKYALCTADRGWLYGLRTGSLEGLGNGHIL